MAFLIGMLTFCRTDADSPERALDGQVGHRLDQAEGRSALGARWSASSAAGLNHDLSASIFGELLSEPLWLKIVSSYEGVVR